MNQQELEEWYIRSLDLPMSGEEKEKFLQDLHQYPELAKRLAEHRKVREMVTSKRPASFGPHFASKIMYKIQNAGIVIDRQIFSFFKKFQLAVMGVIVVLLILNVMLTEQASLKTILGLDRTATPTTEEADVPFDLFETLNKNL
jgi:hypothetical protein